MSVVANPVIAEVLQTRFLMVLPDFRPGTQPVVVVLNWIEELKAKLQRDR